MDTACGVIPVYNENNRFVTAGKRTFPVKVARAMEPEVPRPHKLAQSTTKCDVKGRKSSKSLNFGAKTVFLLCKSL